MRFGLPQPVGRGADLFSDGVQRTGIAEGCAFNGLRQCRVRPRSFNFQKQKVMGKKMKTYTIRVEAVATVKVKAASEEDAVMEAVELVEKYIEEGNGEEVAFI